MTGAPAPTRRDDLFRALNDAGDAAERSAILADVLAQRHGPVDLGGDERRGAMLGGIVAPRARLRRADLAHADLRDADLTHAFLAQARLYRARLAGARLFRADLSHADCREAELGEADLTEALMEEADLGGANLRFADLTGAAVEGARLVGADLWGTRLGRADLAGADLSGATLHEVEAEGAIFAGCDLTGARLTDARCADASFVGADLRGATLKGIDLTRADLSSARLQGVDLSRCRITGVRLAMAQLAFTIVAREQIGPAVGEELAGDFVGAASAYTALERNYRDLGDVDASSWAYRRKRRMQKRALRDRAVTRWRQGERIGAAEDALGWAGDAVVEWVCDYGESVGRVFATLALVFVGFSLLYAATGSVMRIDGPNHVVTSHPGDVMLFSLSSMTSSAASATNLVASHAYASFLSGVQAAVSLFLTGLLGFVAGNRIRR